MSLIIRRVENISKKKRKCTTRLCRRDVFEDDASKFTVIEDFYSENFPPLRPVYRKDIFGTPIVFRVTNGIDYYGEKDCKVLIHCITFMKEYKNKSFEELRWEDYSCGRKEILHYEENSYLKSLSAKEVNKTINYEFFDPAPKNIPLALCKQKSLLSIFRNTNCSLDELVSKKIQNVSKCCSLHSSVKSSKSFDDLLDLERNSNKIFNLIRDSQNLDANYGFDAVLFGSNEENLMNNIKESRPRSILTYVDKLSQTTNKNKLSTKISSEICLNNRVKGYSSRQESIEIMRNNLLRYFEKAEPSANMPYDLVTQNPKFYLPCAEIGFVYQNARPSSKVDEPVLDMTQILGGSSEKPERLCRRDSSYYGSNKYHNGDFQDCCDQKYNCENKFRKDYFWNKLYPYNSASRLRRISRAKYIVAGKDIIC